jgi:DHA1 family bicyclomycin/chloramphenicol resistance-like MFS transporter
MSSGFIRNAIVLGLLSAIGPFAIDMYLPAFPSISADLGASTTATQMTLTVFFISLGVFQIIYGPASDMLGRKPPLYFGIAIFALGSIGCGLALNVTWLIVFRILQGLGAAVGMVVPRAVIRDLHTGVDATRLMSLVMLVFSISPILAPLVGGALIEPFGWRAVFVAVTIIAIVAIGMVAFLLPETQPPEARVQVSIRSVIGGFGELLRDRRFLGLTFIGGFGRASFFAFMTGSSFIYINHFGLTPTQYGLAFSINAVGFIGASQFNAYLAKRFGITRVVFTSVTCYAAVSVLLLIVVASGVDSLAVMIAMLVIGFAWLGLIIPSTMVLALEDHGKIAGMASALGSTLQMITGAIIIIVTGAFFNGTSLPMVAAIAICAVIAFGLTLLTLRSNHSSNAISN